MSSNYSSRPSSLSAGEDLRTRLRSGAERRSNLESYIEFHTGTEIPVVLSDEAETASIRQPTNDDGQPIITVPTREFEQTATNLEPRVFDRGMQYGLTGHEFGHWLYTDQYAISSALRNRVRTPQLRPLAKRWCNICEDAGIEEALRADFGHQFAERLALVNANFYEEAPTETVPDRYQSVDLVQAVMQGGLDLGVYNTGFLDLLLDDDVDEYAFRDDTTEEVFRDLYPNLQTTIRNCLTLGDPAQRVELIFDFWEDLEEVLLDEASEQEDIESDAAGSPETPTSDVTDSNIGSGQEADALTRNDPDEIDRRHAAIVQDSSGESSSPSPSHSQPPSTSQPESSTQPQGAEGRDSQDSAAQSDRPDQDGQTEGQDVGGDASSSESNNNRDQASDEQSPGLETDPGEQSEAMGDGRGESSGTSTGGENRSDASLDGIDPDQTDEDGFPEPDGDSGYQASLDSFSADGEQGNQSVDEESAELEDGQDRAQPASTESMTDSQSASGSKNSETQSETDTEGSKGQDSDTTGCSDPAEPDSPTSATLDDTSDTDHTGTQPGHDPSDTPPKSVDEESAVGTTGDDHGESAELGDVEHSGDPTATSSERENRNDEGTEPASDAELPPGMEGGTYTPDSDYTDAEENEVNRESREEQRQAEDLEEELERLQEALTDDDDETVNVDLVEQADGTFEAGRWNTAVEGSDTAARQFDRYLQQERRSSWQRGVPAGTRPDSQNLHQLAAGGRNVLQRPENGEEKEYEVVIVLDRSGSMNHRGSDGERFIDAAEDAVVRFALGLESLDVDVCIMDMYDSDPRIVSPFSEDVERSREPLMCGDNRGSTPLHEVLEVARKRVQLTRKHPFVLVVTDGFPDDEQAYRDQLEQMVAPVLGFIIAFDRADGNGTERLAEQSQFYDRAEIVYSGSDLVQSLDGLIAQIDW